MTRTRIVRLTDRQHAAFERIDEIISRLKRSSFTREIGEQLEQAEDELEAACRQTAGDK